MWTTITSARACRALVIRAGPSVTSWRPYRHGAVKPIAPRPCLDSGDPGAQPAPARAPRPGCGAETGLSRAAFRSRSGYGATGRPGSLRGKRKATRGARGLGRSAGRRFESTRRHQIPMRSGKLPRGTLRKSASTPQMSVSASGEPTPEHLHATLRTPAQGVPRHGKATRASLAGAELVGREKRKPGQNVPLASSQRTRYFPVVRRQVVSF